MRFINSSGGAFWTKPVIIFVLLLVLLIPLSFIGSIVDDRAYVKQNAVGSIMSPVGGSLQVEGLLLSVPFKKHVKVQNEDGTVKSAEILDQLLITPLSYELSAKFDPQYLKRGIFSVPIFNGDVAIKAKFDALNLENLNIAESDLMPQDAMLILGVGNKKSFTAFPTLKAGDKELAQSFIQPKYQPFSNNIFYKLPSDFLNSGFELDALLPSQGGERLSFVPLARDNKFSVVSSWPSPSFSGGWLPKHRSVSANGFEASWEISGLSTNFPQAWTANDGKELRTESIDVNFISPVNNYSLVARCVTYAILFLAVPFLAIFLCEIYSRVRIHPVQYMLIGVADVLFYLLVLSFSEHLTFALSYVIAAVAVCAAVLLYGGAIFRARKWGVFIALVQAISYCILYGILHSEDYALLLGSVMIFGVIALVMYLTRNIDWYHKDEAAA